MTKQSVYIRLKFKGVPCWHLVEVPRVKLPLVANIKPGDDVDVTQLGKVLESGWGEPPVKKPVDYSKIDA